MKERILYFDCFSGISGDMTLGALIDLGADVEHLKRELSTLGVGGYHLHIQRTQKQSISGVDVDVHLEESQEQELEQVGHSHGNHEHEHHHNHNCEHNCTHDHEHELHSHHHGRSMADIRQIILQSRISDRAKKLSIDIFSAIAEAEGKVHGKSPDDVHFHEVGAVDSIVDIVGTAICLDQLDIQRIYCSPIREGRGFVRCQHGLLPIPVPAVAEMLSHSGLSLTVSETEAELVTPTGFGILKATASGCGPMPLMEIENVGYGFGKRETGSLNALRIFLGTEISKEEKVEKRTSEELYSRETVTVIECSLDDETGEILGYALCRLLEAGALDAYYTPIYMKKNRPGVKLTVLCDNESLDEMADIIFSETSTIGLRHYQTQRMILPRTEAPLSTPLGDLRMKSVNTEPSETGRHIRKEKPEYEDCVKLAKEHGLPLRQVYALLASYQKIQQS